MVKEWFSKIFFGFFSYTNEEKRAGELEAAAMKHGYGTVKYFFTVALINKKYEKIGVH